MTTFTHPALPRRGARPIGSPLVWLLLAALGAAATAFLWLQPATASSQTQRPVRSTYLFDVDATLPTNPVYETRTLRLGDPIFLAVLDTVDVTVDYALGGTSDRIELEEATLQAKVDVVSSTGWQRTLERTTPIPVSERGATLSVPVDFAAARRLAEEIDDATGVSGSLTVRVQAEALVDGVLVAGDVEHHPLDERTAAAVEFALGSGTAELIAPARSRDLGATEAMDDLPGITAGTAAAMSQEEAQYGTAGVDPAQTHHPGRREVIQMVSAGVMTPHSLTMLGRTLDPAALRTPVLALTVLLGVLGGYGVWASTRAARDGAVADIAAAHHAELVPASRLPAVPADRVIDIARFDDLLRIGRELQLPVVVYPHGDIVTYAVTDGLTRYRFETLADAPREGRVTQRSVITRPGRREQDAPGTMIVLDRPIPAEGPITGRHQRRASDVELRTGSSTWAASYDPQDR